LYLPNGDTKNETR